MGLSQPISCSSAEGRKTPVTKIMKSTSSNAYEIQTESFIARRGGWRLALFKMISKQEYETRSDFRAVPVISAC
jgi:hypothetical protein